MSSVLFALFIFQGDVQDLLIIPDPEAAYDMCNYYVPDCDYVFPGNAGHGGNGAAVIGGGFSNSSVRQHTPKSFTCHPGPDGMGLSNEFERPSPSIGRSGGFGPHGFKKPWSSQVNDFTIDTCRFLARRLVLVE